LAETGGYRARGGAAGVTRLTPTRVVIGGGVGKAGDCLFAPLRRAVDGYALAENAAAVSIVPAALGDAGGVLGAVALALE